MTAPATSTPRTISEGSIGKPVCDAFGGGPSCPVRGPTWIHADALVPSGLEATSSM